MTQNLHLSNSKLSAKRLTAKFKAFQGLEGTSKPKILACYIPHYNVNLFGFSVEKLQMLKIVALITVP